MPQQVRLGYALAVAFAVSLLAVACGGSSVSSQPASEDAGFGMTKDASTDARFFDATASGKEAGACNVATCPVGCCDANGRCQTGDRPGACGSSAQACQDCIASGFQACDAARRACNSPVIACGAANCRGCCQKDLCYPGIDSTACGTGGQACQSCGANGLACVGQQCVKPCGAGTCDGCCAANQCLAGNVQTACGQHGGACADCTALAAACVSDAGTGGACKAAPACNATLCPAGCCDANGVCQPGTASGACGPAGAPCTACPTGRSCIGGACVLDCNAATCPTGCCLPAQLGSAATCLPGNLDDECGTGGAVCQSCSYSSPMGQCSNQACVIPPGCDCPNGCCDKSGVCQPGNSNAQCGFGDINCEDCPLVGMQCFNQQCSAPLDAGVCNGDNCPSGCCDGAGVCQPGLTNSVCGNFGTNCEDCHMSGATCSNHQCVVPDGAPACDPRTCNGCCDQAGNCLNGADIGDTHCGSNGNRCVDCTRALAGGTCAFFGACVGADGDTLCGQSCQGCCDAQGTCHDGFSDIACGQQGSSCQNCTKLSPASTCDMSVSPRVCTSQQTQCPAAYPGCPAALRETMPAVSQNVCGAVDLENAASACSVGANTMSCVMFFELEANANVACSDCLQAFDVDFVTQAGIRACVASYVSAACNHTSACLVDCLTESCYQCLDADSSATCQTLAATGSCSMFADPCITQALDGPAALCNPTTYQGNFGAWLKAVGAKYCGP